jgi:hypothetical protein
MPFLVNPERLLSYTLEPKSLQHEGCVDHPQHGIGRQTPQRASQLSALQRFSEDGNRYDWHVNHVSQQECRIDENAKQRKRKQNKSPSDDGIPEQTTTRIGDVGLRQKTEYSLATVLCGGVFPPGPMGQERWAAGTRSIPPISVAGSSPPVSFLR